MPIANEVCEEGIRPITNEWPTKDIGLLDFGLNTSAVYTNSHILPIKMCNLIVRKVIFLGETETSLISACTCHDFAYCTSHRSPAYFIGIKELLLKEFESVSRDDFDSLILVRLGLDDSSPQSSCDLGIHGNDPSIHQGINRLRCTHGDMIIELLKKNCNLNFLQSVRKKISVESLLPQVTNEIFSAEDNVRFTS